MAFSFVYKWNQIIMTFGFCYYWMTLYLLAGLTAYLCGTIFVDRRNPKLAAVKLNSVAQTLKVDKVKLWVFPEGTRNSDKEVEMLPFKKGAFHVAASANLPILPIGN